MVMTVGQNPSIPFIKHRQNQSQKSQLSVNEQIGKTRKWGKQPKQKDEGRDARMPRRGGWQQLDKGTSDTTASPCSPCGLDSFPLASASEFEFQSIRPSLSRRPSSRADVLQSLQQRFRRGPNDGCTQRSPDLPGYFSEEPL